LTTLAVLCYLIPMKVEWDGKSYDIEKKMTGRKLLESFSLSREAHLIVANGKLITEDQTLNTTDTVRIIRVISGG
jgi:sulfur carrier protein ThiS